jgi:hypothetical protein
LGAWETKKRLVNQANEDDLNTFLAIPCYSDLSEDWKTRGLKLAVEDLPKPRSYRHTYCYQSRSHPNAVIKNTAAGTRI